MKSGASGSTYDFGYRAMWFSADGTQVYGCTPNGILEVWDMEKRLRAESWGLTQASNVAAVLPAPEAAVVGLQLSQERNLDVFDLATGKLVSVVQIPFRKARVAAISADARRLILGTDQLSLLVVDFPQGLPPGTIDLAKVLGKMKLPATR